MTPETVLILNSLIATPAPMLAPLFPLELTEAVPATLMISWLFSALILTSLFFAASPVSSWLIKTLLSTAAIAVCVPRILLTMPVRLSFPLPRPAPRARPTPASLLLARTSTFCPLSLLSCPTRVVLLPLMVC